MTTTTNTNVDVALRALALICSGDAGPAVDDVIHPDFVNHRPGSPRRGPEGFRDVIRWLGEAFADISITPDDLIACGDKVVARTRFKALHVGPFNGIPPSNRTIEIDQIHVWRTQDGLIAENWACMDELSGFRQMGITLPSKTDTSTPVTNLARRYSQSWANRDPDAIAAMHTRDSVFHLHNLAEPFVGRDAIYAAATGFFADSPDLAFEPVRVHFGEDHFVSEYVMRGTRDGRPFACHGNDIITVKDDLVQRKDSYIDWIAYQRQTGIDIAAIAATVATA